MNKFTIFIFIESRTFMIFFEGDVGQRTKDQIEGHLLQTKTCGHPTIQLA